MFHCLHFKSLPIFEQLQIEEALLRLDDRNWCIINENAPPAIVMGIAGKPQELIEIDAVKLANIPVIKRYSGGGTVVVDQDTVFVSLLCKAALHLAKPYPEPIMKWSESLYKSVICHPNFSLLENDYVIGNLKCGGNAQYITKSKWVHHTTFLWDYQPENMSLLKFPQKRPTYRQNRGHDAFLCRLKDHLPCKDAFIESIKNEIDKRYGIAYVDFLSIQNVIRQEHRKSTKLMETL
ncbi:MAG: lipoate--protein ligase family protein [Chlamydiales bacterium]|nr:lipoate--protein ligase family protein [Chlamydiales bacterium]